jgi:ring-1,2-phenylacetyl-CoA epoxidase subunit PaaB
MTYSVPEVPGEETAELATTGQTGGWPMWEVFVRQRRGLSHVHAGSLHAADSATALQAARDVYTRRVEGVSVWVVPSMALTASDPDEADAFFESIEKPYRHAAYYQIPDEVGQM